MDLQTDKRAGYTYTYYYRRNCQAIRILEVRQGRHHYDSVPSALAASLRSDGVDFLDVMVGTKKLLADVMR